VDREGNSPRPRRIPTSLRAGPIPTAALEQFQYDWAAEWVLEFQSNLLRLQTSTGGSRSSTRGRPGHGREGDGSRVPAGEASAAQPATPAGR
jgi:hypothetical protein